MKIRNLTVILLSAVMMLSLASCRNSDSDKDSDLGKKATTEEQETIISGRDEKSLEDIIEYNDVMERYIKDTLDIIDKLNNEDNVDENEMIDKLSKMHNKICSMKEDIEELKESKDESIQMSFDVAKKYFTELEVCYGDLLRLVKFCVEFGKADQKYDAKSISRESLDTYYATAIHMYKSYANDLAGIERPEYLTTAVDRVISMMDNYIIVFENYYDAIANVDYLKAAATDYMYYYAAEELDKAIVQLVLDMQAQLDKAEELLSGRMQTYQNELDKYCKRQLEESVKPKYTYYEESKKPSITYTYEDKIYPATYSVLDSVIRLTASCDQSECEVIVKVEIPEFATTYEQKLDLGYQITRLNIKPVIDVNANLDYQKTVQMKVTVTDADSNKIYVQDSNKVTIMSKNDLELFDVGGEDGSCYNLLAWMTPESDAILELKRVAIEWLNKDTDGAMNELVGYQGVSNLMEAIENTAIQALSIQNAMSALGVRYNVSSYSSSTGADSLQRVMYPSEVLESKSGICVETALVVASALQSADFNVMLVIPPGHCMVAVEAWPGSGEYIVIETTSLPTTLYDPSSYVAYIPKENWQANISEKGWTIVDCSLARKIGFVPYFN
ncbi:MAG: hypothetical protein J6B39_08235 [Lachnospiraceae bacterium]|nr:hypothetical protein [Lachnospiraceae bacterium]